MDISVVVPLFNEEESLPELVAWIDRVMRENGYSYEVLLIDDGSRDKSWEVICKLQLQFPAVRGIRFQRNYGKSAALQEGFQAVTGEVVITMDADMQDSPDEVPGLYKMITEDGFDLVSGYKQKRYDPISKTVPSKFFNWITRMVSGIHNLHDFNCGLKAYRQEVVKNIEVYGEMHRYIPLLAKWAGYEKIEERVVEHRPRKYGTTKFGLNRFINGFLDLISIVFTHRYLKQPMHFFGTWGVIFALLGLIVLSYMTVLKLFFGIGMSPRLPALMFGTISLLFGMIMLSTGLLAEMIGRQSPYKNEYRIKERRGWAENQKQD